MKIQDIRSRIAEIDACKGDYEVAHSMEDKLYLDVLKEIAGGAKNAKALAAEAIKAADIEFGRYTA